MTAVRGLAAASGRYPRLTNWLRAGRPAADEQFDLGLGFVLDGIAAQLPAPARPAPHSGT